MELTRDSNRFKRIIKSKHLQKSALYIVLGAAAGFLIFYITEGRNMNEMVSGDIINSLLLGGFFGFFITNSPCARGKC